MSRLRSWIRWVLPDDRALLWFVLAYVAIELFSKATNVYDADRVVIFRPSGLLLPVVLFLYGWYRACEFHPAFRGEYREWLARTPWTSRLPPPLGPIHLVTQDLILVLGLIAWAWWRHPPVSYVWVTGAEALLIAFLLGYELPLVTGLFLTADRMSVWSAAFGLGLMARLWTHDARGWAVATALAVYAVSYTGLQRSLARFSDWSRPTPTRRRLATLGFRLGERQETAHERIEDQALGWPYDLLRPDPECTGIRGRDALSLSLLAGWWLYVIGEALQVCGPQPRQHDEEYQVLGSGLIGFSIAFRLIRYCLIYHPSLSVAGSRVLVAPMMASAILGLAFAVDRLSQLPKAAIYPVAASAAILVLLGCGPTLRKWKLTGAHRLATAWAYGGDGRNWVEVRD